MLLGILHAMKLYQDRIAQYYKSRPYSGKLAAYTHKAIAHNPLCGDAVIIYAIIEHGVIQQLSVQAEGCVLSVAAASMLAEQLQQSSIASVGQWDDTHMQELLGLTLGPNRLRCATLPVQALVTMLKDMHA